MRTRTETGVPIFASETYQVMKGMEKSEIEMERPVRIESDGTTSGIMKNCNAFLVDFVNLC